jgi:hypothetical protein
VNSVLTRPPKQAPTPAERRRRKARRAWIPTVVISAVIAAAVVTAVLLHSANLGRVPAVPTGNSKFTIAGLRVVDGAADAQLDVRKPISAASVGLPGNTVKTFGPFDNIELEVDLTGIHGTASIFVDTMKVATHGGVLTTLSTRTRTDGFAAIHNQLESLTALGLTNLQLAAFENAMPDGAGSPTSHFALVVGVGTALGVPTRIAVSCADAKGCEVTTTTTLRTT